MISMYSDRNGTDITMRPSGVYSGWIPTLQYYLTHHHHASLFRLFRRLSERSQNFARPERARRQLRCLKRLIWAAPATHGGCIEPRAGSDNLCAQRLLLRSHHRGGWTCSTKMRITRKWPRIDLVYGRRADGELPTKKIPWMNGGWHRHT